MDTAGLLLDLLILAALGASIAYAARLSRQFARMQADRQAFEQLIQALNVAAGRAEAAIRSLKDAARAAGDGLQEKVSAARGLAEELEIMVQAGDSLAERLGSLAEKGRKAHAGAQDAAPAPQERARPQGAQPRTRAEKELLEAVRAKQQS